MGQMGELVEKLKAQLKYMVSLLGKESQKRFEIREKVASKDISKAEESDAVKKEREIGQVQKAEKRPDPIREPKDMLNTIISGNEEIQKQMVIMQHDPYNEDHRRQCIQCQKNYKAMVDKARVDQMNSGHLVIQRARQTAMLAQIAEQKKLNFR